MSKHSTSGAGHAEAPPSKPNTQGPMVVGVVALLITLDTAVVALRLWARRIRKVGLWWDDWITLFALAIAWGGAIECWMMTSFGLGEAVITDFHEIVVMIKIFLAWVLTYPVLVLVVRTSLLLFYLRLFGLRMKMFRWMWIGNMTFAVLICVAMIVQTLALCMPLSGYWNGTCHNTDLPSTIVINIANTLSDLGILILPIPTVWSLQMPRQRKIALSGVFGLGSIGVIISALRTPILVADIESIDTTFIEPAPLLISFAEPSIGIICACLPTMRPFIQRLGSGFKSTFGSHHSASAHQSGKSAKSSSSPGSEQTNGSLVGGLPHQHAHQDSQGPFYPLESVRVEKPADARYGSVDETSHESIEALPGVPPSVPPKSPRWQTR